MQPDTGDVHVPGNPKTTKGKKPLSAFVAHLMGQIRGRYSAAEWSEMVAKSRAHAGGKGKAEKTAMCGELADVCAYTCDGDLALVYEPEMRFSIPFAFAEPPDRIPLLPKPGVHQHPSYGQITITRDRNQRFMDNFTNRVYQHPLPIDAEHETLISGAFGWINDVAMNEDGSVDGLVSWSDRGVAAIKGDRFKFISPAWRDEWPDPLDNNKRYRDVLMGAALTTRPFFKNNQHGALRALVASEEGLKVVGDSYGLPAFEQLFDAVLDEIDQTDQSEHEHTEPADPATSEEDTTVGDEQKFTDLQAQIKALSEAQAAQADQLRLANEAAAKAQADAESLKAANEKMGQELATSRDAEQARRFGELATGWAGDKTANVTILTQMAKAFGEDSETFQSHVRQQVAVAEQLKASALFSSRGVATGPVSKGEEAIEATAKRLREADPNLTEAAAIVKAAELNEQNYAERWDTRL